MCLLLITPLFRNFYHSHSKARHLRWKNTSFFFFLKDKKAIPQISKHIVVALKPHICNSEDFWLKHAFPKRKKTGGLVLGYNQTAAIFTGMFNAPLSSVESDDIPLTSSTGSGSTRSLRRVLTFSATIQLGRRTTMLAILFNSDYLCARTVWLTAYQNPQHWAVIRKLKLKLSPKISLCRWDNQKGLTE